MNLYFAACVLINVLLAILGHGDLAYRGMEMSGVWSAILYLDWKQKNP